MVVALTACQPPTISKPVPQPDAVAPVVQTEKKQVPVAPPITGVDYHPMWSSNDAATRKAILDKYQAAGVKYVRIDIPWDKIETSGKGVYNTAEIANIDLRIKEIDDHGMKAVVMLWMAPSWATGKSSPQWPQFGLPSAQPLNPADYGDALAWVGNRWAKTIAAVEMWNEPDEQGFWSNGSSTETEADRTKAYARLIVGAYPVAKAKSPATTFILAAPDGLGLADKYFEVLYANGIAHKYDALAVHPYVQPSNTDPQSLTVANDYGVWAVKRVVTLMEANGDGDKKIWATEFGFSTHKNTGAEANWDRGVTEQQQADFIKSTFTILGGVPQVQAAFVYNDRDVNDSTTQQNGYGLLTITLTPKLGYYSLPTNTLKR